MEWRKLNQEFVQQEPGELGAIGWVRTGEEIVNSVLVKI